MDISDGNPQNPNETEANTATGVEIDVQQFMKTLAAYFIQSMPWIICILDYQHFFCII